MTLSGTYRRAAWLLALTASLLVPAIASADDEAITRFERGVALYEAQNYEAALAEFGAAYKLSKNYKLLYNIGICQQATKDYASATSSFQKYLAEGGSEIAEPRRADVQERLSKLALMVTSVKITTDAPAGAEVRVDDRPVGTTPLAEAVTVNVGRRQFSLTADGRTVTKTVELVSGDGNPPVVLTIGAPPAAAPPGVPSAGEDKPPVAEDSGPSFPWPLWVLTGVVGGAAAVTGTLAVGARNDFEEKQATFGVDRASLEDDRDRARTLGIVTDVLLVGTVVSAGLSTYLTIRWLGAPKRSQSGVIVMPTGVGYSRSF